MDAILLNGVKTHNLKNFDLQLPHRKLYVLTGVSGSGKSSLAFDTLYAEGQRRYVESMSAYARQFLERMDKPDVESVSGIPPAIAIQAKNVVTNARSTVGTQTEVNDYLRVLFSRIGKTICPQCETEVRKSDPVRISNFLLRTRPSQKAAILFEVVLGKKGSRYLKEFLPELEKQGFYDFYSDGKIIQAESLLKSKKKQEALTVCADQVLLESKNKKRVLESLELAKRYGKGRFSVRVADQFYQFAEGLVCHQCGRKFREPTPNLFSFNSPLGACSSCQGFGRVITLDWDLVIPDINRTIYEGAVEPWTKPSAAWEFQKLLKFCRKKKIPTQVPWKKISQKHKNWILKGCPGSDYFSVQDFFKYLEKKTYKMHVRIFLSKYRCFIPCRECRETRLKPEALCVKVRGKEIHQIQCLNINALADFMEKIELTPDERGRVQPVYLEILKRVRFLKNVGLGYLNMARLSRTLSGGEVQRIHLATSLGSALVDTLYVLDEPSIGLHERDNNMLIQLLHQLRDLGNTVVVVEHDRSMIEAADEVIDLGPDGGENGGRILFQGNIENLAKSEKSLTGQYLSGRRRIKRENRVNHKESSKQISILEASEHNLKKTSVHFPLNQMVVVTGVSGSGKSTLIYDVLYRNYLRYRGRPVQEAGAVKAVKGLQYIDDIHLVDQAPIGRTARSNPVTYLKIYDEIRKVFAASQDAKTMGFKAGDFSFNVEGGRCDVCKGDGAIKVEMHFLADVFMTCEACRGTRFKKRLLKVRTFGKNIHEVLQMTVDDAMVFFDRYPKIVGGLNLLKRVGLGYLRLGQPAPTLSGGEAQRLKIASEMSVRSKKNILYLFDEPTTGLHYHDIHYLMDAFEALLKEGHSLVIIEHNMEIIAASDTIVDLGPEGGEFGGEVVFQGSVQEIMKEKASYTGKFLSKYLKQERLLHNH